MIADYLRTLIDYHEWATQRLLGACMEVSEGDYRRDLGLHCHGIHGTLNHLLQTEELWLSRYLGRPAPDSATATDVYRESISGRDTLAAALREQCRQWRQAVSTLDDASATEQLRLEGGVGILELSRVELLFQVISYAIQLRGQLIYALTSLGNPDPGLDFLTYSSSP
ncbi:DinB family protein [Halotalea alkalilenta]|uniref:DinB family protein n=1 Tax=Halotalea alkalilenta TaxID=376489 RepID=UPI0004820E22|nr:DinB family protein [Halotalea alkalilenta]